MVNTARLDEFIAAAEAAGTQVLRFQRPAEALSFVSSLLQENGYDSALLAPDVLEQFPQASGLSSPMPKTRDEWMSVEVGLVRADYGVAKTGTLVHLDRTEEERLTWTLPSLCICLLSAGSVVQGSEELASAIAGHLNRRDLSSPDVSFVTGPSRTADIEGQLVCGVHGPKCLIVLLLDSLVSTADENH